MNQTIHNNTLDLLKPSGYFKYRNLQDSKILHSRMLYSTFMTAYLIYLNKFWYIKN